eukprot:TRINITY_DN2189_c0_g2_i1.p1 TRINITY_DN2189_c0_g2~~TRINITY_DN2189_c0_g2_i1.p1  ORF type:complete len:498 (+),score=118.20 TRINITY_DN2189_c0_g2_i1:125-1618(+)
MATPPMMPSCPHRTVDERSFTSDIISQDGQPDYPEQMKLPSWRQFLVTGGGFMIDQYNLFVIGTVVLSMGLTPGIGPPSAVEGGLARAIKLIGAMIGQIGFGYIADKLGRKVACCATLLLVVVGALGSSYAKPWGHVTIYGVLCLWQLILGIGVGGEYPLSASLSRESASDLRSIGATFCMQGFGFLLAPLVVLCLLQAHPAGTTEDLTTVWRCALGFSVLPALILLIPRYRMHQSRRFETAAATKRFDKPLWALLGWNSRRRLLGTAGCWLLFDVSFYGNSILAAQAFSAMHLNADPSASPHDKIKIAAQSMLVVALLGLPGYFAALYSLQQIGLRNLQIVGFLATCCIFGLIGAQFASLTPTAFLAFYGLTFFFSNFGPNFTTFILPAVLFDTCTRARCHGLSAAAGKLGGALGVWAFSYVLDSLPPSRAIPQICYVCSMMSAAGLLLTVLCVDANPEAVARSYDRKEVRSARQSLVVKEAEQAGVRVDTGYGTL